LLGNVADEIHMKETILEHGASNLHVVGQLEAPLEAARGNAAIEKLACILALLALFAPDRQYVTMCFNRDVFLGEARNRHRNAIGILAGALDIIGRIRLAAIELTERVKHGEKPVEPYGRSVEGRKIDMTHGLSSCEQQVCVWPLPETRRGVSIGQRPLHWRPHP